MSVSVGAAAPNFTLPTDDGASIDLAGFKGRKLVLYFYPKADTPGCTLEAMDFQRLGSAFAAAGAVVVGISPDPCAALGKFKEKHGLGFTLAADEAHDLLNAYGIWVEKSMYGRTFMGVERTTVLIDAEGRIARIWPKVKVEGHAEEVLAAVEAL